jgi:hypothetical protein
MFPTELPKPDYPSNGAFFPYLILHAEPSSSYWDRGERARPPALLRMDASLSLWMYDASGSSRS